MIPERRKTINSVSWWYRDDTGIILEMILDALALQKIPIDANFMMGIKVLGTVNVLLGIIMVS